MSVIKSCRSVKQANIGIIFRICNKYLIFLILSQILKQKRGVHHDAPLLDPVTQYWGTGSEIKAEISLFYDSF